MQPDKTQQNKSPEKLLSLLSDVHNLFNDSVKKDEFLAFVKQLMASVNATHERMLEMVAQNKGNTDTTIAELKKEMAQHEQGMEDMMSKMHATHSKEMESAMQQLQKEVNAKIQDVLSKIPTIPDLTEKFLALEEMIPEIPDQILGEDMRNALEALPTGDKLAIDAIENLQEELDKIRKIKSTATVSGGGIVGRDIIKDYDLSPYLDGATKTFNIPAVWNIVSVDTSSFPHALRKNIDYTWTPQSITFTSEIDETTTLAQGQTVILTIVSA